MMKKQEISDEEKKLTDLAIKRNIELGELDTQDIDRDDFMKKLLQAKQLGVFLRDREMSRRIETGQVTRIINLVSTDSEQRRQYIEIAMPQFAGLIGEK